MRALEPVFLAQPHGRRGLGLEPSPCRRTEGTGRGRSLTTPCIPGTGFAAPLGPMEQGQFELAQAAWQKHVVKQRRHHARDQVREAVEHRQMRSGGDRCSGHSELFRAAATS
jgi:hypothetical protein